MTRPVLEVRALRVRYLAGAAALHGVDLTVASGQTVAVVGESGCGKTTLVRAVLGLLPRGTAVTGSITLSGRDLLGLPPRTLRRLRGTAIGYVAQDPYRACDPVRSVGHHVAEAWYAHRRRPPAGQVTHRLRRLGIAVTPRLLRGRPHTWSGGMLQRAVIAAATAHEPALVLADEPTSALDADHADDALTVLRAEAQAVLVVSHDLSLVARHADEALVLYAGRIVERLAPARGGLAALRPTARHPYTQALLAAVPVPGQGMPVELPGRPPAGDLRGCVFVNRCARVHDHCRDVAPAFLDGVACHLFPRDGGAP